MTALELFLYAGTGVLIIYGLVLVVVMVFIIKNMRDE